MRTGHFHSELAPPKPAGHRLRLRQAVACLGLLAVGAVATAGADAATITFGSPLSVAATKDTAHDLNYSGSDTQLPGSIFHNPHDGADTALWNVQMAGGNPTAPASGQIVSVSIKGCAQSNGPPPLTQIHFQDLAPQQGGAVKVNVTTQAFDIPICGQEGAGGDTVSTYRPTNFCVAQGDYVDFNDEGGFVPSPTTPPYPSGVPYMVIGSVAGSTMDSFIRNGGVGNGTTFSPSDTTYHDGFASNANEELLLQATLATDADATPLCPGGTKGAQPGPPLASHRRPGPLVTLPGPQLDGMNSKGVVRVVIYCHARSGACSGLLTLSSKASRRFHSVLLGTAPFSVPALHTGRVMVHLDSRARRLVSKTRGRLGVDVTMTGGDSVAGPIAIKASIALRGGSKH
ncbi:MAG TPA: hypothetical protein VGG98_01015 [Solirubrobacteraceae bacterium]|jgi:hypothetical protein